MSLELRVLRDVGDDDRVVGARDLARIMTLGAGDDSKQGRFAGTIAADESDMLAALKLEADGIQNLVGAIEFGYVGDC